MAWTEISTGLFADWTAGGSVTLQRTGGAAVGDLAPAEAVAVARFAREGSPTQRWRIDRRFRARPVGVVVQPDPAQPYKQTIPLRDDDLSVV